MLSRDGVSSRKVFWNDWKHFCLTQCLGRGALRLLGGLDFCRAWNSLPQEGSSHLREALLHVTPFYSHGSTSPPLGP